MPTAENLAAPLTTAGPIGGGPSGVNNLLTALLAGRPTWHADALCQEHPEVSFFPERGDDVRPAKQICARCLVKTDCRTWALAQDRLLAGIWAGTSTKQRRQLRNRPAAQPTAA